MAFAPIAIVGRACLLPGVLESSALWAALCAGADLLSPITPQDFRLSAEAALRLQAEMARRQAAVRRATTTPRGGLVRGFEKVFDPTGYAIPPEDIRALDPLFQWTLHVLRCALRDAGMAQDNRQTALYLANLGYEPPAYTTLAERIWLEAQQQAPWHGQAAEWAGLPRVSPANRFSCGYAAHLAAEALGLGEAFALDAACASALYAIGHACEALHQGRADVALAAGVNHADPMIVYVGFGVLQALSPSAQSRPFDAQADGLIPGEGAAAIVLKRLDDALAAGDRIYGLIRGVGLSNDGRAGGLLVPDVHGQLRALRAAYEHSGLDPHSITLLECHATGTVVGDGIELKSCHEVFAPGTAVGSIKGNMGHTITVAGLAAMMKVLGALEHQVMPPNRPVAQPIEELGAYGFHLLQKPEPWQGQGPRRAGINAFGFGGNNAHVVVEEWDASQWRGKPPAATQALPDAPLAVVALEVAAGGPEPYRALMQALLSGTPTPRRIEELQLVFEGLRYPPKDLAATLPQQLLVLETARHVAARLGTLEPTRSGVFIGMGCDAEIARYVSWTHIEEWVLAWRRQGLEISEAWLAALRDAFTPRFEPGMTVGTMPNIVANRIGLLFNLQGPGYAVCAEELSGIRALEIASHALRGRQLDVALVGAVDLCCEPVHEHAARAMLPAERHVPGDAAVVLALMRLDEARAQGRPVLAIVDARRLTLELPAHLQGLQAASAEQRHALETWQQMRVMGEAIGLDEENPSLPGVTALFGHAHATSGLLHVASGMAALYRRMSLGQPGKPAIPWLSPVPRQLDVHVSALGKQRATVHLREGDAGGPMLPSQQRIPRIFSYGAADLAALREAVAKGEQGGAGPCRLVHVAADAAAHEQERPRLIKALSVEQPAYRLSRNAYFRSQPVVGEMALVFPGAAAAYPGMGRELLLALPELLEATMARFPALAYAQGWLDPANEAIMHDPAQVLLGSSFLCQVHALLSREWLKLEPQAVLGVSSGETNAVLAMGAWRSTDLGPMLQEIISSGMYSREITGEFAVAQRGWGVPGPINWRNFWVLAPVAEVQAALAGEERVYLSMINSDTDCVIAGDGAACERVAQRLGGKRIFPLGHDIIAHCPLMENWREPWYRIHHRETVPVPGVRFYSNASGGWYEAERDRIAEALTNQATAPVDFRRVVHAAYEDGVRIFIENGPRGSCANWIGDILGQRDHVAVHLDRPHAGLAQLVDALAQLEVCGVPVEHQALLQRLAAEYPESKPVKELVFPAHFKPVIFPPLEETQPQAATLDAHHAPAPQEQPRPAPATAAVQPAPEPAQASSAAPRPYPAQDTPPSAHEETLPAMETMPAAPHVALPPETAAAIQPQPVAQAAAPAGPAQVEPQLPRPQDGAGNGHGAPSGRRQIMDQISHFYSQVSATHRQFLGHQTRAMDILAELSAQATAAQGGSPPVMQRMSPAVPAPAAQGASTMAAPPASPPGTQEVRQGAPATPQASAQPAAPPTARLGAAAGTASPTAAPAPQPGKGTAARPAVPAASSPLGSTPPAAAVQAQARAPQAAAVPKPVHATRPTTVQEQPPAPQAAAVQKQAPTPQDAAVVPKPAAPRSPEKATKRAEPAWFKKISAMALSSEERLGLQAFRAIFNYTFRDAVPEQLPGPKWGRRELEILASDRISKIMGPQFEPIDQYEPIVRMPMPPLLLADSVLGIDAEPLSMSTHGKLWTESVVEEDNWYLHHGHVPPGIALEMGQADLLLISWLGVDLENQGQKVYRLLGIDAIPFRGPLKIGERMIVDINCGGYATLGGIRLFFFHSHGWVDGKMISAVRNGQAGFFTEEILKSSGGILWDPVKDGSPRLNGPLDPPAGGGLLDHGKRSFTKEEVFAFSEDRVVDCFGPLYAETLNHTRTPRLQRGLMLLIDEVLECDPRGGPWGRGYIKAIKRLSDDEWFYDGHFKGDPCMPGTLTMEAIAQLAIFACAAMGYTVGRDGWRFEPLLEEISHVRARGQTIPGAREVIYELFVEDVSTSDVPTFHAQGMSTVDGLRSFHGSGCGGRLVPGYPMESRVRLLPKSPDTKAARVDGLLLDRAHLLHLAWGKPSDAFGETYAIFDWTRRCPRLPGPPLLLLSRIEEAPLPLWSLTPGARVQLSWDVGAERWLTEEQRAAGVPLWALAEHGLQGASWLLSALGAALAEKDELRFDLQELRLNLPKAMEETPAQLRTSVQLAAMGEDGTMVLEGALTAATETMARLAVTMAVRSTPRPQAPPPPAVPQGEPATLALESTWLPDGLMRLVDQAHGFWPQGGEAGLGMARVGMTMHHGLWFFTCHTFGAPRWPCGFYLEMATQAGALLARALGQEAACWRAYGEAISLRVHDETRPGSGELLCDVSVQAGQDGPLLPLAARFHQGERLVAELQGLLLQPNPPAPVPAGLLDPADPLLADYAADWGPVLPPLWLIDRLGQAALERLPGRVIVAMPQAGWEPRLWRGRASLAYGLSARLEGPNRMRCTMTSLDEPTLVLAWASFQVAEECSLGPRAAAVLEQGTTFAHPYTQGLLYHGPAWQAMTALTLGATGASAVLHPAAFAPSALFPALLDAALQSVIPDEGWWSSLPRDKIMVPYALEGAEFFRPSVRITEEVRLESRLASQSEDQVRTWHQLMHQGRTWAQFTVLWRLEAATPWDRLPRKERARWWQRHGYHPEAFLSHQDGKGATVLERKDLKPFAEAELRACYGLEPNEDLLAAVALREHAARLAMGHPAWVSLSPQENNIVTARSATSPGRCITMQLKGNAKGVRITEAAPVTLDSAMGYAALEKLWPMGEWLGRDLMSAVLQHFAGGLYLEDPTVLTLMGSSPVLYVANHQIDLEGIILAIALTAMSGRRCRVMARDTVRQEFWGRVFTALAQRPGVTDPDLFLLVEKQDINAMWQAFQEALRSLHDDNGALLIHVEGVHKDRARARVEHVSAALVDTAVALELPLVPVRFAGSLPIEPVVERPEWPVGLAAGRAWMGSALMPHMLRPLTSKERTALVAQAINTLGAPADALENEQPAQGDPAFHEAVAQRMQQAGVNRAQAILYCLLVQRLPNPSEETQQVLALCAGSRSPQEAPAWLVHFAKEALGAAL